jgi:N-acetylglucosamine-6-phosphate deacetylase
MSPEVLQKMFEMASSSRGNDLVPVVASALNTDGSSSFAGANPIQTRGKFTVNKNGGISGVSSSLDFFFKFEKYSSVKLSCLNF